MGITAVVNQKGGVGKTTVTLGLASSVAASGRRVLVVDMDPQANATTGLGVWNPARTIDAALEHEVEGAVNEIICDAEWPTDSAPEAVQVAPSSPSLAQREHQLGTDMIGAQERLSVALSGVSDRFDEVLIDCPPSLGLLTVNALFAADQVLIVAEPAAWSSDGVDQILRNVGRIAQRREGRPAVAGIVINRLGRTRDGSHWADQLRETHGEMVLEPPVRLRAAIAEAAAQSLPVHALTRSGAEEAMGDFDGLALRLGFVPVKAQEGREATAPAGGATESLGMPAAPAIGTKYSLGSAPGSGGQSSGNRLADTTGEI